MHSGCSEVRNYEPKNQQFKVYQKSTETNIIPHIFLQYQSHAHVSTNVNILTFYRGGGGSEGQPPKPNNIFFKSNEMEAFSLRCDFLNLFLTFVQDTLNPQNYELAPQFP